MTIISWMLSHLIIINIKNSRWWILSLLYKWVYLGSERLKDVPRVHFTILPQLTTGCTASSLFLQTRLFEPHRIQQWVAISSSRGSSRSTDWTRLLSLLHWQAGSLPPGKPLRKPRPHATQNKNQACYRHILGFLGDTSGKEPVCLFRRLKRCSFDPWVRKIPGGGNGNLFQYSCLENPMDRGAWKAAVHHVSKSQTWLRDWANTRRHWTCRVRL